MPLPSCGKRYLTLGLLGLNTVEITAGLILIVTALTNPAVLTFGVACVVCNLGSVMSLSCYAGSEPDSRCHSISENFAYLFNGIGTTAFIVEGLIAANEAAADNTATQPSNTSPGV